MMAPWGKTDADGRPSHHLAHHSMDVAACLEGMLATPVLRARAETAAGGALDDAAISWLAAFSFLHDVGKLSPAFQAKAWPEPRGRTLSHLTEGAVWAERLRRREIRLFGGAADLLIDALIEAGRKPETAWFEALFAHHGRPIDLDGVVPPSDPRRVFAASSPYDWRAADEQMGEALTAWFPAARIDPALLRRPELAHLFAGLLALADWIGSDVTLFPHALEFDHAYGETARDRARAALRAVGLADAPWPASEPDFAAITGYATPRGAQAAMEDASLDARLLILEAETGSGKTEAALRRFARLRSAGLVDALCFAVPTRAAAGQLQRRIDAAMARIGGPEVTLAVPGQLRVGGVKGYRLPHFKVRWDDDGVHWAAEHATRFLAASVAVGTVDQALMAGLQVRHAPMRASALSRSLLVVDEVHASDAYMNAIARPLVRSHLGLGGHALLMSATLGSRQRAAWMDVAPPAVDAALSTPYPAVWRSDQPDVPIETHSEGRVKTVWPALVDTMDPDAVADRAIAAASSGARVLVIRNTVTMAVATWRAVVERRPDLCLCVNSTPTLHHARFAAEDRQALDSAIEAAFGVESARNEGVIGIGTQTLEQSLDIDADYLLTDLCPIDVLLQRIGRLHRHARGGRPTDYVEPRCEVFSPKGGVARLAPGPSFENGLGAWSAGGGYAGIYLDLIVLELTRRLIEHGGPWRIPIDNRRLVEGATHPQFLAEVEDELGLASYASNVVGKTLAEGKAGQLLTYDRQTAFPPRFADADEIVRTRLGAMGPLLSLPPGTDGPFGLSISQIAIPAHMAHGIADDEAAIVLQKQPTLMLGIGGAAFDYGATGLRRHNPNDFH